MIAPFANDPFALLWQAFKNLYPNKKCVCFWESDDREMDGGFGFTEFAEDGTVYVVVSANLDVLAAVEVLAHELAHVAVGASCEHGGLWEDAFEKIYKECNKISEAMCEEAK